MVALTATGYHRNEGLRLALKSGLIVAIRFFPDGRTNNEQ